MGREGIAETLIDLPREKTVNLGKVEGMVTLVTASTQKAVVMTASQTVTNSMTLWKQAEAVFPYVAVAAARDWSNAATSTKLKVKIPINVSDRSRLCEGTSCRRRSAILQRHGQLGMGVEAIEARLVARCFRRCRRN